MIPKFYITRDFDNFPFKRDFNIFYIASGDVNFPPTLHSIILEYLASPWSFISHREQTSWVYYYEK